MKKKTLLLAEVFPPERGGIQTWGYQLAKNYDPEMIVVAPPFKGCSTFDQRQNFNIIRAGHRPMNSFIDKTIGKIANLINPGSGPEMISAYQWLKPTFLLRNKVKAIDCIHIRSAYLGYLFKKWFDIPYFVFGHGLELESVLKNKAKKKFYSQLLENSDLVFVNSSYTKKLIEKFGVNKEKIVIIPLGVDYNIFKPNLETDFLKKRYNLNDEDKVIFSLSRLVKRKGFDSALKAFATTAKNRDDLKYIIGGTGPEEKNLKELASQLEIEKKVIFTGPIKEKDLPNYFNLAKLFIMPSRALPGGDVEGFGIVFLEAGACQTPVIGGRSGGVVDAIEDGQSGYLVDPENASEIAKKMELILNNDNLAIRLGKNGRARVIEKYNWINSVKIVSNHQKKIIKENEDRN